MDTIGELLGISLIDSLAVVISATILYATVGIVIRGWGRRLNASASAGTIALITLVGSIAARAILGNSPDLLGGLVAIGTLVILERVFGRWTSAMRGRNVYRGHSPVLLQIGDRVRVEHLDRFGLNEDSLRSLLRQQGIGHTDDVAVVVLEPRGGISVLRRDRPLQASMLEGVEGAEDVPPELFRGAER